MSIEWMSAGLAISLTLMSSVHDHMYSRGERKTTFFKWTGSNFSPLLHMAESIRKGEAKGKARQKR
jgi:hypothetical protein